MRSASLHFSLLFFFSEGFCVQTLCVAVHSELYIIWFSRKTVTHTRTEEKKKMEESDKAKWLVEHFAMRKSERMRFLLVDKIPNYIYIQFGGVASRSLAFSFA